MNGRQNVGVRIGVVISIGFLFLSRSACADGIPPDYFLRVRTGHHSLSYVWTLIAALMLINYAWNFAVIGWPAIQFGAARPRGVGIGLIFLTLLGQIADRLGAIAALIATGPIERAYNNYLIHHFRQEAGSEFGEWIFNHRWFLEGYLVVCNFAFSGIMVSLLAWVFLKRWSVARSTTWKIMVAAAIFANPAWVLMFLRP